MLLAIDIGNTNIEFGVFEGKTLLRSARLGTNRDATSDEIGIFIRQFCMIHGIDYQGIEDVVIASVVPQIMYSMTNAVRKYLGKTPLVAGENIPYYVENRYDNPAQVGADRLVNVLPAVKKYGAPLIIVDFGTATTFDAISREGAYEGGAIYPGVKLSMDALAQKASKLPQVAIEAPGVVIGKNTVKSMQVGAVYGYVGAVENICRQMKKELGEDAKVIATGGLASMIAAQTNVIFAVDKTLTITGLRMIYDAYRKEQNSTEK